MVVERGLLVGDLCRMESPLEKGSTELNTLNEVDITYIELLLLLTVTFANTDGTVMLSGSDNNKCYSY